MSTTETPNSTTPSELRPQSKKTDAALATENIVKTYGDLLFDFCESVLWSPIAARLAFRAIVADVKRRYLDEAYVAHERAWVLSVACDKLRELADRHGRKLTPSEQIELDSSENVPNRLKKFDSFFHRLGLEDRFLLLLKDKYGIPFAEIATALGMPEGSLKVRRAQALRALEDWIWESPT